MCVILGSLFFAIVCLIVYVIVCVFVCVVSVVEGDLSYVFEYFGKSASLHFWGKRGFKGKKIYSPFIES